MTGFRWCGFSPPPASATGPPTADMRERRAVRQAAAGAMGAADGRRPVTWGVTWDRIRRFFSGIMLCPCCGRTGRPLLNRGPGSSQSGVQGRYPYGPRPDVRPRPESTTVDSTLYVPVNLPVWKAGSRLESRPTDKLSVRNEAQAGGRDGRRASLRALCTFEAAATHRGFFSHARPAPSRTGSREAAPRGGLRLFIRRHPDPLMPIAPEGRGRPHLIFPRLTLLVGCKE